MPREVVGQWASNRHAIHLRGGPLTHDPPTCQILGVVCCISSLILFNVRRKEGKEVHTPPENDRFPSEEKNSYPAAAPFDSSAVRSFR